MRPRLPACSEIAVPVANRFQKIARASLPGKHPSVELDHENWERVYPLRTFRKEILFETCDINLDETAQTGPLGSELAARQRCRRGLDHFSLRWCGNHHER